jgi:hypothetical protein
MNSEEFNEDELAFLDNLDLDESESDNDINVETEELFFTGAGEENVKELYLSKKDTLDYLLNLMQ